MSLFGQLSWFTCILTAVILVGLFYSKQYIFVKPSYIGIGFLHASTQWSSAIQYKLIESSLSDPWDYYLMVQLFPLVAILVTNVFWNRETKHVFNRIRRLNLDDMIGYGRIIFVFVVIIIGVMAWYLSEVPFRATGLYAILYDSERAVLAREESMKLLQSPILKYSFSFISFTIAPILSIIFALTVRQKIMHNKWLSALLYVLPIALILFSVSIYGARAPSAIILLNMFLAIYLYRPAFKPGKFLIAGVLLFLIPAALSLLREGREFTFYNLWFNYLNIFDRAFGRSIIDGIWHVQYVQEYGYFGWEGIGNIIRAFGLEPINTFNIVGRNFVSDLESISANTSFVVSYYSCFGGGVFVPCVFLLCLVDMILVIISDINNRLLLPCLAGCLIAITLISSTMFTTVLVSFGYVTIPLTGLLMSKLSKIRFVRFVSNQQQSLVSS